MEKMESTKRKKQCYTVPLVVITVLLAAVTVANTVLIIHLFRVQSRQAELISSLQAVQVSDENFDNLSDDSKERTASNIDDAPTKVSNSIPVSRSKRTAVMPVSNSCLQGLPGRDGRDGHDGKDGQDGKDGKDGTDGAQGALGANGLSGDELEKILTTFQQNIISSKVSPALKVNNMTKGGAVYVRWGRTACPSTAALVYDGVAGGSYYSQTGGGSEKLCLPHDPQWGKYKDGFQSKSYMYGAEYEINGADVFTKTNANSASVHDHNVPCAVCYTESRSTQLMIPARKECPTSWTKEYGGYLMAARYDHQRSSFDCMDEAPEVVPGGQTDQNGALFYNVEAACGSLPCPNYVSGRELTCVVCTK